MITRAFVVVLVLAFIGFSIEQLFRPVVPLMVIQRGGDVVMVGIVSAMAAVPSIVLRPLVGRSVDVWDHRRLLVLGAAGSAITAGGLLLPGIVALSAVRFAQGAAWGVSSVSMHALMAKLAPADRRGEASGYFTAMPALATLVAPGIGVALFLATGDIGPVVAAVVLGLVATAVATRAHVPSAMPVDETSAVRGPETGDAGARAGRAWIEPSAIPATLMVTTFMSAHALFTIFPGVYALSLGAPLELLAVYYPLYGLVMTVSQFLAGKVSDRAGRGRAIRLGCVVAVLGIVIAAAGGTMHTLAIGGMAYAASISLVGPTLTALTIDRAPPGRIGSAMATYLVGYQLATGASSLLWSVVIAAGGFPAAFLCAVALQGLTFAASLRAGRAGGTGGGAHRFTQHPNDVGRGQHDGVLHIQLEQRDRVGQP
jgi:MFS family permease